MLGLKVTETGLFAAEIIRKVREREALSRVELARELGVAASTIGRHVDSLVDKRYFTETVEPTHEAGRPPTRLRPNPQRGCFIGVDFFADGMYATAVDFAQQTLVRRTYELDGSKGTESVLAEITLAMKEMRDIAQLPVLAAGVATPGQVDTRRGVGIRYFFIDDWKNVPLAERLGAELGIDIYIENNVRAMSLAERWFGEVRGCTELICLGIRAGVSAGVIRNGHLATGIRELGGEIRGWSCPLFNPADGQWRFQAGATVESHASVPAAVHRYEELSGKKATISEFLEAGRKNDPAALTAIHEVAAIHGWAISQMVQLTDPEFVILAGPLTTLGETYIKPVSEMALKFESDYHPGVPIRSSSLGEYAGAVGAAALALERWKPADVV